MLARLLEAVRAEASGARALASVRRIATFHRVQASPGYDAAAAWLLGELNALGVPVEVDRVPGDGCTRYLGQLMPEGWECTHAIADLIDQDHVERLCDYQQQKLSLVLRSDPARGRFRVVDVGDGTDAAHYQALEVRGAVVLSRGAVQRVHQLAVVERGAAGILTDVRRLVPPVRVADTDTGATNYTSFWWQGDEPRGFGFVIPPRVGDRLRARLAGGAVLDLAVEIESRRFATEMPLLSATLPGTEPGEVLIVSHLCHPQACANDNASGVASNLEALRVLAALRASGTFAAHARTVRFLWVPELTGTYAWFARDRARVARTVAALNLDMVGEDQHQCGSTLLLEHPPCFAASFAETLLADIRVRAVDSVSSFSGPGHYSMMRMAEIPFAGGSDHTVLNDPAIGIPCPMLIQWPDRFYHSSSDTPDKTDPDSLALAVRCAATFAAVLASADATDAEALLGRVEREARVRLLRALSEDDPAQASARERLRGGAAIRSLGRLGVEARRLDRGVEGFDAFARREGVPEAPAPARASGARRPHRRIAAPLHYQRFLLEGWRELPAAEREAWRALEEDTPDAILLAEIAWFACDGTRSVAAIADLVELETGCNAAAFLERFFEFTARLALSEWRDAVPPGAARA